MNFWILGVKDTRIFMFHSYPRDLKDTFIYVYVYMSE